MDTKELLTKSIVGVIEQGNGSFNISKTGAVECKYRANDGSKCAVGQLISDDSYDESIEPSTIINPDGIVVTAVNLSIGRELSLNEIHYLRVVQESHDVAAMHSYRLDMSFIEYFKDELMEGVKYGNLPEYIGELECLKNI